MIRSFSCRATALFFENRKGRGFPPDIQRAALRKLAQLHAVTELNLAGADQYKIDIAKKNVAYSVNRLNLVASSGVLKSTNDLLDFLNEHLGKEFDAIRLHNILNTLVIEARRDLNPGHARKVEDAQVRFRFFAPPKK